MRSLPGSKAGTSACSICNRGEPTSISSPPFWGFSGVGKNPTIGAYYLLTEPLVALPSCLGIQRRAGHTVPGCPERLARHGARQRADPRMDARGADQGGRVARSGTAHADLLNGSSVPCIINGTSRFSLRYAPLFWQGVAVTLAYTAGTILLGLMMGLLIGLGRLARANWSVLSAIPVKFWLVSPAFWTFPLQWCLIARSSRPSAAHRCWCRSFGCIMRCLWYWACKSRRPSPRS